MKNALGCLVVLLVAVGVSQSATVTWDGAGGTNDWSDDGASGNWTTASEPGTADTALFSGAVGSTNTVDAGFGGTVNTLQYQNTAATHATTISSGVTLIVDATGGDNLGLNVARSLFTGGSAATATIAGDGTLQIGNSAATDLTVTHIAANVGGNSTGSLTITSGLDFSNVNDVYVGYNSKRTDGTTGSVGTLDISGATLASATMTVGGDFIVGRERGASGAANFDNSGLDTLNIGGVLTVGEVTREAGNNASLALNTTSGTDVTADSITVGNSTASTNSLTGLNDVTVNGADATFRVANGCSATVGFGNRTVEIKVEPASGTGLFSVGTGYSGIATVTGLNDDSTVTLGTATSSVNVDLGGSTSGNALTGPSADGQLDLSSGTFNAVNVGTVRVGFSLSVSSGAVPVHLGVLDLSGATLTDGVGATADQATVGEMLVGNGQGADGTVKLPEATVIVSSTRGTGDLTVGGWTRNASTALLDLAGTIVSVEGTATLGASNGGNEVISHILGSSAGLSIENTSAAAFSVVDSDGMALIFDDQSSAEILYWGFRWAYDSGTNADGFVTELEALVDAGSFSGTGEIDVSVTGTLDINTLMIDNANIDGTDYTYIGFQGIPEPATLSLVLIGALGVIARRKRKQR